MSSQLVNLPNAKPLMKPLNQWNQTQVLERLLEKGEQLTLDKAIGITRTYEATLSQME